MLVTRKARNYTALFRAAAVIGAGWWLLGAKKGSGPPVSKDGMVWIPGGTFHMGCADCDMPDALPVHTVIMDGFRMQATPVTNQQFARFVDATGYVSIAERKPEPRDLPGVAPQDMVPGSAVFTPPQHPVPLDDFRNWWTYVPGADWRHPEGPGSDIKGRLDHPVVHIAYED